MHRIDSLLGVNGDEVDLSSCAVTGVEEESVSMPGEGRKVSVPCHDHVCGGLTRRLDGRELEATAVGAVIPGPHPGLEKLVESKHEAAVDPGQPRDEPHDELREPSRSLDQRIKLVAVGEQDPDPVGFEDGLILYALRGGAEVVIACDV